MKNKRIHKGVITVVNRGIKQCKEASEDTKGIVR